MSVKLCLVSAKWPKIERPLGCGHDTPSSLTSSVVISLGSLNPDFEAYTFEQLKLERQAAFRLPDKTYDIWRWRTIYTLAQNEAIFCISFIPKEPHKAQIIQVMRLKSSPEEARSLELFCHDLFSIKFILPVKNADQVYDLSQRSVTETISQFTLPVKAVIEKALASFSKDSRSLGLALTLEEDGKQRTYIWLKG
ncbi:MAG TPA: hypothetical protein VIJ14_06490 [Rhabdochlamydiaceae bacterium]